MKIFAYNASSKNPRAEHRVNLHIVAKKNENNSLINGIVKKRRSQKLKRPCIEERSDELAGTGAILGESLFLCKSANKQLNFSSFFCPQIFKSYNIICSGIFMQISCKYFYRRFDSLTTIFYYGILLNRHLFKLKDGKSYV